MDLQYVIDLVDEIVVTFDAEGIITMANLKADELLPIRRKDFVHHNVDVLLKEHYVESDKLIIKEVLEQRKTCYLNVPYSNGVMIFYTGAPSFDANGKFNGGVLTGRDITRLIRQQTMVRAEDQQEDDSAKHRQAHNEAVNVRDGEDTIAEQLHRDDRLRNPQFNHNKCDHQDN